MTQQTLFDIPKAPPKVDTRTFGPACDKLDVPRITKQMDRIREYMLAVFPAWKTLAEISEWLEEKYKKEGAKFPEASVSAQLRHLRKPQFGSYDVKKKRRSGGLWEYLVYRN